MWKSENVLQEYERVHDWIIINNDEFMAIIMFYPISGKTMISHEIIMNIIN